MATYNTFRELANYLGVDPDKPTPESQKLVYDWMQQNPEYEPGSVTNKYMEGYEPPVEQPVEPQPVDTPPQDVLSASQPEQPTPNAMAGDPRYQPKQQAEQVQSAQPAQTTRSAQPINRSAISSAISRWTPVVAQVAASVTPFSGIDPTGESAGARALAGQNQKTASDLSKIVQWNKQRATDNTLADKIAAAQASGQWRQNANALGAEGGASVVASQNQAVTPDIMAQKQYQSQSMGAAGQALTEADKHKRQAIANETNANRTDYFSGYNEALNNQATNLATASGQQDQSKEKKSESTKPVEKKPEPTVQTQPVEKKSEPAEQDQAPVHQAETNQQSDSVDTASQIASDNQQLEDLISRAEGINTARKNGTITPEQESEYSAIEAQFNELANKMGGAPRSLPPLYVTPEESKPEDKFNSDEYKNQPAVVDPELSRINPELLYQRYGQ